MDPLRMLQMYDEWGNYLLEEEAERRSRQTERAPKKDGKRKRKRGKKKPSRKMGRYG